MTAHHNTVLWTPMGDQPWVDRALCAQTDPEAFFPEKGGSTREAKKVCRSCEVRTECLAYAVEHNEPHGIWGGMSERERRRIRTGREVEHTCQWCGGRFTSGSDMPRKFCTRDCRSAWQSEQVRRSQQDAKNGRAAA